MSRNKRPSSITNSTGSCKESMNGQPQDITKDILLAVRKVFCAMLFDSRYDMDDPKFARLVEVDSVTHVHQWICG